MNRDTSTAMGARASLLILILLVVGCLAGAVAVAALAEMKKVRIALGLEEQQPPAPPTNLRIVPTPQK
jgi:hypothetical protein